jgi:hypothetical protein
MRVGLPSLFFLLLLANSVSAVTAQDIHNTVTWILFGVNFFFDVIQWLLIFVGFFYLLQRIREESTERTKSYFSTNASQEDLTAPDPQVSPSKNGKSGAHVSCEAGAQTEEMVQLRSFSSIRSAQVETHRLVGAQQNSGVVEMRPVTRDIGIQADMAICVSYSPKCPPKTHSQPNLHSVEVQVADDMLKPNTVTLDSQRTISRSVDRDDTLQSLDNDVTHGRNSPPSNGVITEVDKEVPTNCTVLRNGNVSHSISESETAEQDQAAKEDTPQSTPSKEGKDESSPVEKESPLSPERKDSREDDYSTVADALMLAEGQHVVVSKKSSFSSQRKGLPRRQLILGNDDYCEVVFNDDDFPGGKVRRTRSIPRSRSLYREDILKVKNRSFSVRSKMGGPGARHPEDTLPTPPSSSASVLDIEDKEGTPFTEVDSQHQSHNSEAKPRPPVRTNSLPSVRMTSVQKTPPKPLSPTKPPPANPIHCKSPPQSPTPPIPEQPETLSIIPSNHSHVKMPREQKSVTESPVAKESPVSFPPGPPPARPRAVSEYTFVDFKKKKKNRKPGDLEEPEGPPSRYKVDPPPTPLPVPTSPTKPPTHVSKPPRSEYEVIDIPPAKKPSAPPSQRHVYEDTESLPFSRRPKSYTPVSPTQKSMLPV